MAPQSDAHPPLFDSRLRGSLVAVIASGAVLTLGAAAFAGGKAALSVGVGAVVAAGNLWALARIIVALLPRDGPEAEAQNRAGWAIAAALKMFGLVAVAWFLMRRGLASPLPMLIGFGSLPIGIAIGSLVSDRDGEH